MKKLTTALLTISILVTPLANAELKPKGVSADHRVKVVSYDENNIVAVYGHYGYQTDIVLSPQEEVRNVAIGDAGAWEANYTGNHLFIRPMAASSTNMTVLTNKRSYYFHLQSTDSSQSQRTYKLRFYYPEEVAQQESGVVSQGKNLSPASYNWKYSYSGSREITPIQLFDNGEFTYFKFRSNNSGSLPAIFIVNKDRTETLVNYHVDGDYIVVNRIAKQFTLRNGSLQACVFNKAI